MTFSENTALRPPPHRNPHPMHSKRESTIGVCLPRLGFSTNGINGWNQSWVVWEHFTEILELCERCPKSEKRVSSASECAGVQLIYRFVSSVRHFGLGNVSDRNVFKNALPRAFFKQKHSKNIFFRLPAPSAHLQRSLGCPRKHQNRYRPKIPESASGMQPICLQCQTSRSRELFRLKKNEKSVFPS